ncbi:unnamed protein product [Clonostachys rosea]|uniref:Zn(2)-C6 fungal-type domain-containing protein n=1 Tax=Bionectria ochroleuca TaxID=29856 RepID=A0ABY6UCA8_BIOOC|nr:unnamed protein product [Clonostachys rosea]
MPGVVKSTACQLCKARKIKCARRHLPCPGPSSLRKFVNNDTNQVQRHSPTEYAEGSGVLQLRQSRPYRLPKRKKDPSGAESQSSQALGHCNAFRFQTSIPRADLTTRADRVASRLVYHIKGERNWGWVFSMQYLQHLPNRLSESPSLRDTVALFCSVLGDYRRGKEASEFLTLPAYGKALNSLRRTLKTSQGFKMETLASIIMLERTESVFDRGRNNICLTHAEAIATMIQKVGPPKADDQLHLGLVSDCYGTLAVHFLTTGRDNFMTQDPWKGLIEEYISSLLEAKEAQPHLKRLLVLSNEGFGKLPTFVRLCQMVHFGPRNTEATEKAAQLMCSLAGMEKALELAYLDLFEKVADLGLVCDKPDPDSITGSSYELSSVYLAQFLVSSRGLQSYMLRMLYDCSIVYDPDETPNLYARLTELCEKMWKFAPYLKSLESCVASSTMNNLFPTLEFANVEQKELLIDMILVMDRFRQRLPKDRFALEQVANLFAMQVTGRLTPTFSK